MGAGLCFGCGYALRWPSDSGGGFTPTTSRFFKFPLFILYWVMRLYDIINLPFPDFTRAI